MTNCFPDTWNAHHGLLDHLKVILNKHLYSAIVVSIILIAAICIWLRRRQQKSMPDTESWMNDDKILIKPPSLPELVSEYSHPLTQVLFQQSGIPTSGDLILREQLDSSNLAHSPFPISVPNSGDLNAMAVPNAPEEQRHPWRRHSHPEWVSSDGDLNPHQRDALITEDSIEFFRDDKVGKLWRRRTLEFGSIPAS